MATLQQQAISLLLCTAQEIKEGKYGHDEDFDWGEVREELLDEIQNLDDGGDDEYDCEL